MPRKRTSNSTSQSTTSTGTPSLERPTARSGQPSASGKSHSSCRACSCKRACQAGGRAVCQAGGRTAGWQREKKKQEMTAQGVGAKCSITGE